MVMTIVFSKKQMHIFMSVLCHRKCNCIAGSKYITGNVIQDYLQDHNFLRIYSMHLRLRDTGNVRLHTHLFV